MARFTGTCAGAAAVFLGVAFSLPAAQRSVHILGGYRWYAVDDFSYYDGVHIFEPSQTTVGPAPGVHGGWDYEIAFLAARSRVAFRMGAGATYVTTEGTIPVMVGGYSYYSEYQPVAGGNVPRESVFVSTTPLFFEAGIPLRFLRKRLTVIPGVGAGVLWNVYHTSIDYRSLVADGRDEYGVNSWGVCPRARLDVITGSWLGMAVSVSFRYQYAFVLAAQLSQSAGYPVDPFLFPTGCSGPALHAGLVFPWSRAPAKLDAAPEPIGEDEGTSGPVRREIP